VAADLTPAGVAARRAAGVPQAEARRTAKRVGVVLVVLVAAITSWSIAVTPDDSGRTDPVADACAKAVGISNTDALALCIARVGK